jgi:hypothetical protein
MGARAEAVFGDIISRCAGARDFMSLEVMLRTRHPAIHRRAVLSSLARPTLWNFQGSERKLT